MSTRAKLASATFLIPNQRQYICSQASPDGNDNNDVAATAAADDDDDDNS